MEVVTPRRVRRGPHTRTLRSSRYLLGSVTRENFFWPARRSTVGDTTARNGEIFYRETFFPLISRGLYDLEREIYYAKSKSSYDKDVMRKTGVKIYFINYLPESSILLS